MEDETRFVKRCSSPRAAKREPDPGLIGKYFTVGAILVQYGDFNKRISPAQISLVLRISSQYSYISPSRHPPPDNSRVSCVSNIGRFKHLYNVSVILSVPTITVYSLVSCLKEFVPRSFRLRFE